MMCLCRSKKNFHSGRVLMYVCVQTFLGRHCSIPACSFKFYVPLSVGKQWPQTKGQWSHIQTLALAHQLPGIFSNLYSFVFSSAFAVPFEAQHLVIALKMLSAFFWSTWDGNLSHLRHCAEYKLDWWICFSPFWSLSSGTAFFWCQWDGLSSLFAWKPGKLEWEIPNQCL